MAVDADGCFTKEVSDFSGRYVKDADKDIINAVKVRHLVDGFTQCIWC